MSTWFLFDTATGQPRGISVGDVAHINSGAFSTDGRWFWVYHSSRANPWDGIDIVDTETGKRAVELRERNGEKPLDCCFSPDNKAVAVHWRKQGTTRGAARDSVRIVELPFGRELRNFDLPTRPWQRVDQWIGDRLYAEVDVPNGPMGYYLHRSYSFDLLGKSVGEGRPEPLLSGQVIRREGQTYWDNGPGWLASLSLGQREPERWKTWVEWVATKIGMKFRAERGLVNSVRFLDPATGRLRYELAEAPKIPCVISHNGKLVAGIQPDGVVQVWEADPPPRWPWTAAAGMLGAGSVLMLGRWRHLKKNGGKKP